MKQRVYREYYENGKVECEKWYVGDKRHRTDGPAYIWYYENGKIEYEVWYIDDKRHKTDGPAVLLYNKNGDIEHREWWVDGDLLDEEEMNKLKIMIELNKEVLK